MKLMFFKLSLFLITFSSVFATNAQVIKRMEPHNWWVGMHKSDIQIMLYGDKIAQYDVEVDGLTILNLIRTENPNYIFVTVDTKSKKAGKYPIRLKKKNKLIQEVLFELQTRRQNSAMRSSFDASDLIYLIMPDRFANGNPNNDSHPSVFEKVNRQNPGGRHGGDIQGIINHLDYLFDLGVTAIWTTPLLEDNDSTYSYHTYGQSDLYKIDPRYGTNEDYRRLVVEAHKRGIKIIKDEVPNHWGYMHWMMFDLPTYDWIHQFPGYGQTNYRSTTQMDPNHSQFDFKLCEKGWFVKTMPDLNQNNPLVLNYLIQNTIWWIEYADLDGIRVDTYPYNDKWKAAEWTKAITDEYPNMNIVGEVWLHDQAQISYWQKNSPIGRLQNFNSFLPSVMDFTFHDASTVAFSQSEAGWSSGLFHFYENLVNDFLYANPLNLLIFLENHDTERFNHLYTDFRDYQLALILLATHRGIPQIYYGSEIGMAGDKSSGGDADIRQDFPGGWHDDKQNAFTKTGRTERQEQYHAFTKKIFNWRKGSKTVHFGKTIQFLPHNNLYVYFRILDDACVMVVLNNSLENQHIELGRFAEVLSNYSEAHEVLSNSVLDLSQTFWKIEAKTGFIIELK